MSTTHALDVNIKLPPSSPPTPAPAHPSPTITPPAPTVEDESEEIEVDEVTNLVAAELLARYYFRT
ncbi:hypothetical protein L13192_09625 [Pyrenophora tritici-repentis]|nr:hypothetical protein L13192_09625 [Pyrenophora tritici-repentis]